MATQLTVAYRIFATIALMVENPKRLLSSDATTTSTPKEERNPNYLASRLSIYCHASQLQNNNKTCVSNRWPYNIHKTALQLTVYVRTYYVVSNELNNHYWLKCPFSLFFLLLKDISAVRNCDINSI